MSEISPSARGIDMVDGVRTRLDQIGALLWMMRNMDDLAPGIALALGGIETAVEDAGALLSVHSARGAA
ncbi:hypothetical protein [Alteriqipengyuania sp.]|uniref:hypothetical protein n=1 Tax=Alteriqipengyuania sp. TaxID=2800692 RepID=UPI003518A1CD